MEIEDFVYVLVENNVYDKPYCNEQKVYVFWNLEDANQKLLELKNNFEENDLEEFTIVDETNEKEDLMYSYCAYESGNYNNNHYELTIYQREI